MRSPNRFPGWIIAILSGLAALQLRLGLQRVHPLETTWLFSGDASSHLLGWYFFRKDEWRFPLGVMKNFMEPIGASIGATDSIPLFAVLFKLLGPLFPQGGHFFGIYLLVSFLLLPFFTYLILKELTGDGLYSGVGSILTAFSAPLLDRIGHIALCAHFVIVIGFYIYLRWTKRRLTYRRAELAFLLLNFFNASVHPYLLLFSLATTFAFYWAAARQVGKRPAYLRQTLHLGSQVVVSAITLWAFGYFWFESSIAGGFGYYAADTLSFFNSMDRSLVLPGFRTLNGQYEGFGYLGLGGLLSLAALVLASRKKLFTPPWKKISPLFPLFIGVFLLWMFSIGSWPKLATFNLLNIGPLYRLLGPIPGAFRSSGRFIWAADYALLIAGAYAVYRLLDGKKRYAAISCLALLQVIDLKPFYKPVQTDPDPALLFSASFQGIGQQYRHLALLPPFFLEAPENCAPVSGFTGSQYFGLAYTAAREKMGFNSGMVSRPPRRKTSLFCDELWKNVEAGNLSAETLYILTEGARKKLQWPNARVECQNLKDLWACAQATAEESAVAAPSGPRSSLTSTAR